MSIGFVARCALLVQIASCWRSTPDPVAPSPAPSVVVEEQPAKCGVFDTANAACKAICPREDPGDWPGCIALVDQLVSEGYTCAGGHPRTCLPPAYVRGQCPVGGCVGFTARVIGIQVVGNRSEVVISGGADRGVTTAWKARLLDASQQPVSGMDVTLIRVDRHASRGMILATPAQVRNTPFVRLEP